MPLEEKIESDAYVRGSMVNAHLGWARRELAERFAELSKALPPEHVYLLERPLLASQWVSLAAAVNLARAIAEVAGGDPQDTFIELGRESARLNLGGVYRSFQSRDAHQFFRRSALLHGRFQSFGKARFKTLGERCGEFSISECSSFSPVYCAGERGYLEEAIKVLGLSAAPKAVETDCTCAGQDVCRFRLSW